MNTRPSSFFWQRWHSLENCWLLSCWSQWCDVNHECHFNILCGGKQNTQVCWQQWRCRRWWVWMCLCVFSLAVGPPCLNTDFLSWLLGPLTEMPWLTSLKPECLLLLLLLPRSLPGCMLHKIVHSYFPTSSIPHSIFPWKFPPKNNKVVRKISKRSCDLVSRNSLNLQPVGFLRWFNKTMLCVLHLDLMEHLCRGVAVWICCCRTLWTGATQPLLCSTVK